MSGTDVNELEFDAVVIGAGPGGAFTGGTQGTVRGTARFLVDEERDVLVGATITGTDVADLLQGVTIAIVGEVPFRRLRHAIPASPPGVRSGFTCSTLWVCEPG